MIRHRISSYGDILNWVDDATSDWPTRDDMDILNILDAMMADQTRPDWGEDWTEYLDTLDLAEMATKP